MTVVSRREEELAKAIVDAAYAVHKSLGPGLLESIYEACFCHELGKRRIPYRRQVRIPLVYDGLEFSEALRLDVLVDDLIICELKCVDSLKPIFLAQALSQLKLTGKHLGFLINFNVSVIKQGIQRIINSS